MQTNKEHSPHKSISFLSLIAADMLQQYGGDMRDVTVVFPGKRAGMFLDREFPLLTDTPVWTPGYCTMNDLFLNLTHLQVADPVECICTLHAVMQDLLGAEYTETLDQFWSWGEVLMADFDDIDKHMGDARAIFTNIADSERLWSLDYLDEGQRQTLKHFFGKFSLESSTEMQRRFLNIWSHMHEIYTTLHTRLLAENKLWEGALFRHVAERMSAESNLVQKLLEGKRAVVFAGFNVLNDVEQSMMQAIDREGKARFYWDYDIYYTSLHKDHEAGFFMKQNLRKFKSAITDEAVFDNFRHLRDVTFIACTADNAAARIAGSWLQEHRQNDEAKTAVILCNEALMQPVLHAIPTSDCPVNVTMGFPVSDTPVHGILMALMRLQLEGYDLVRKRFRFPFEQTLRQQPLFELLVPEACFTYCGNSTPDLLRYLIGHIRTIAACYAKMEQPDIFEQLYSEAAFRIDRMLCHLLGMTTRTERPLMVLPTTLRRLLRPMMASAKIPFHSEPDKGLQVMGMLETRCLDFSHMLMLSVEENILPRNAGYNSFIPANLREAFGLTTPRHRIAVSAYYFYRLVQRANHLTCIYNESTGETGQHEMSRFLRQMLAETDIPIQTRWLRSKPAIKPAEVLKICKSPEVMLRLRQRYDQNLDSGDCIMLSPSAINIYMECPMRFYLDNVLRIRREEEQEDGISSAIIGNIFHDTAEFFYSWLQKETGTNVIAADMICEKNGAVRTVIDRKLQLMLHTAFDVCWFHPTTDFDRSKEFRKRFPKAGRTARDNEYKGTALITFDVLLRYLRNLLKYDARHAPFRIIGAENERTIELTVPVAGSTDYIRIKTGGRIDRIDEMDGHIRIVDYKTGIKKLPTNITMKEVTAQDCANHERYYLQTFLYALAELQHPEAVLPVKPILFFPAKAADKNYDPSVLLDKVAVSDFGRQCAEEFKEGLMDIVSDIFNPQKPFECTNNKDHCKFCKLQDICGNR